jgi:hypothetical protein
MAEQHSQTADYENRWKFTGHELDKETGLYYAGARQSMCYQRRLRTAG